MVRLKFVIVTQPKRMAKYMRFVFVGEFLKTLAETVFHLALPYFTVSFYKAYVF